MSEPPIPSPDPVAPKPRRWPLRRTLALVLIVSGVLWLVAGLAIRFLFL